MAVVKNTPFNMLGITESRASAAMVLADLRNGAMLDAAFERYVAPLDARDRRWVQELLWGMLRTRNRLDAILAERVRGGIAKIDVDVADLLRLGAYQLLSMGSVPAYAAIGQTVELTKRRHGIGASKLVNAVLRRIDRERDTIEPPAPSEPLDALAQPIAEFRAAVEGALNQAAAFLARHANWRAAAVNPIAGRQRGQGIRLTPFRDGTDGFFFTVLQRLC